MGFDVFILYYLLLQSLVANEDFQHILRVLNTNVDGKQKIMFALTSIKGIGRRFANIVCKKADVDMNKRFVFFVLFLFHFLAISSGFLNLVQFEKIKIDGYHALFVILLHV